MIGWGSCSGLGFGPWVLLIVFWVVVIVTALWVVSRMFPRHDPRVDVQSLLEQTLPAGDIDVRTDELARDKVADPGRH